MAINGRGRPTKEQADEKRKLNSWNETIAAYEREFKSWEGRVEKILKRYRDERIMSGAAAQSQCRFNILWSNVQTLVPATFGRLPQPDVSRRFKDNDQVGRVASLILERALDFEVQHYPDYRETMTQSVHDRFLGGRGTAWARYEPHIWAKVEQAPQDGVQVTEDQDEPDEELEYECAPVDYVHWRDFGHSVARTWEEVTRVWRKVYMTRAACIERFGEELGSQIPLDTTPEDKEKATGVEKSEYQRALVIEGWDKEKKEAVWISKSMGRILDTKPDPLGLEGFFPCPKPLFATLTNETLVPIPDFTLYQDQAIELDTLSDRIDGLVKALQLKGMYDASIPELGRLFTEAVNTNLIAVNNWAAFAEKSGLAGALDLIDLKPIGEALREAYTAMEQVKGQVYEITGISDIIRGQTEASETATAQEIKGRYASLRLKHYQEQVAVYATHLLRLKAQIMCAKFDPQTLIQMSAADQLAEADKQLVPQAMELLLGPRAQNPDATLDHAHSPLRSFRIDIAADTLVQMDEEAEKKSRMEFISGIGEYFAKAGPIVQQAPALAPLVGELLKYVVAGFKAGKTVEGIIDAAMEEAKKPQPPRPDPEMEKLQLDAQDRQAQRQLEDKRLQFEVMKHRDEMALRQAELAKPDGKPAKQVNPEREAAEVGKIYADIDKTLAEAEKARREAEIAPQRAAIEAQTAEVGMEKTKAEAAAVKAPVDEAKEVRDSVAATLQEVMQAVASLQQGMMANEGRTVKRIEKVRNAEGRMVGVRHHLANGEVQEVAVH